MNDEPKTHLFDKPRNVKRALRLLYAGCAALLVIELLHHREAAHPWESWWGFHAGFGFIACVALVLIAKQLRRLLMRGEHYYQER